MNDEELKWLEDFAIRMNAGKSTKDKLVWAEYILSLVAEVRRVAEERNRAWSESKKSHLRLMEWCDEMKKQLKTGV